MSITDQISKMKSFADTANNYVFTLEEELNDVDPSIIELPPVAGAPILGELTEIEQKLYRITVSIENNMEDINEELGKSLKLSIAQGLLDNDGTISEEVYENLVAKGQAEAIGEFLRVHSLWSKTHSAVWHMIRTRLQTFTTVLEIRAGFTICRVGSKISG